MGLINEIGNVYGYLTVIERAPNNKDGRAMWKCKCKCGNEVIVLGKHLRSGNTKSCGCYQKERAAESNLKRGGDLTGRRFGKLVVLEEAGFIKKAMAVILDYGNVNVIVEIFVIFSMSTLLVEILNLVGVFVHKEKQK